MCKMFWKTSSASHCFCFKPFTQCTFTERIICSIVCLNVYNFLKKFLMRAIASAWSPPLSVHSLSAYFVQLYVWMCRMFWKTSSASHCFCFKPTTQCTFTERVFCSIVCLNAYNVSKNFFWKLLLLLETHHSV